MENQLLKDGQKYKQFAQKKDGWCGPAALQFALAQLGKKISQEELVRETKTTVKEGCDPYPLEKTAKEYGVKTEVFTDDNPNKLLLKLDKEVQQNHQVLVDYLVSGEKNGGHYVVFLGKTGGDIRYWNPSGGKVDTMRASYFIENWRDRTEGGKLLKNWAMVMRA